MRKNLLLSLLIVAVLLTWFSPWWAGGKFFAPLDLQNRMMSPWGAHNDSRYAKNHFVSDGVDQYLVYRLIAERDYRLEGRVGWSNLTYGGTAQYANTMALYDDWSMQLHRWFGFNLAWHLGLLGQLTIAALGMFLFLRGRAVAAVWCVTGALLWAANSQFVTWAYHRWTLSAFCWVPWILWAIDEVRKKQRWAWACVPMFLGLSFLGGTLQHAALVVIVVACAWLEGATGFRTVASGYIRRCVGMVWKPKNRRPADESAEHGGSALPAKEDVPLWHFALWGLLGVGLAAFMFVPNVLAFIESNRLGLHTGTYGHGSGWYPEGPLQPLYHLISYPLHLFPSVLGRCDSLDVLKLFKSKLFYVLFFGTIPMLLALVACFKKSTPFLAKALVATGLLLPLSPLVRVLYQRLFLLAILGGILAFAHFMTHASRETKRCFVKWLSYLSGAVLLLWLCVSAAIRLPAIDSWLRAKINAVAGTGGSFGYHREWVEMRIDRFMDGLVVWSPNHAIPWIFLFGGIVGLWLHLADDRRWRRVGTWIIATAALADVSLFGSRWLTWSDEPMFAKTPEVEAILDHVGTRGRVTTLIHPTEHMSLTPFVPNILAAYGIATITGYDSIVPDGMILPNESPGDAEKLGRLAVTHLITWGGNPDVPLPWRKVWSSKVMDFYENPLSMPRYAGDTGLEWIRLNERLELQNSREIELPPGTGQIRVAENAAPGWLFRIKGDETWQKVKTNPDGSMKIDLPAADKTRVVEMRYDPPARKAGWAITILSALLLCAPGAWAWIRHRRQALACGSSGIFY